jgi:hypothetical protein
MGSDLGVTKAPIPYPHHWFKDKQMICNTDAESLLTTTMINKIEKFIKVLYGVVVGKNCQETYPGIFSTTGF